MGARRPSVVLTLLLVLPAECLAWGRACDFAGSGVAAWLLPGTHVPPQPLVVTIRPWILLFIVDSLGSQHSGEKGWSPARGDQSALGNHCTELTHCWFRQAGLRHHHPWCSAMESLWISRFCSWKQSRKVGLKEDLNRVSPETWDLQLRAPALCCLPRKTRKLFSV